MQHKLFGDEVGKEGKGLSREGLPGKDGPKCTEENTPKTISTPNPKTDKVSSTNDYSQGYFEFLDIATGQPGVAFSTAQKPHIIVAADEGKVDVRNWLPIRIEIKKDGQVFWTGKIEGNTAQICRGATGCSTNGPSGIGTEWKRIDITAFDKNGEVVATFFEIYNP